jgi:thiol peroxidase
MLLRIAIGLVVGLIVGGGLGYLSRYLGGANPSHAPYSGAVLGAMVGVVLAFSLSGTGTKMEQVNGGAASAATKGTTMSQAATVAARTVTMHGQPVELVGTPLKVGDKAPDFVVVNNDFKEVRFYDLKAKVFVLSAVPSLDTPVCDRETHRFNVEAGKLPSDVKVLTISMDLPFAQKRWCAAAGVANVQTVSDYRYASFGSAYGVLIKDARLEARCVFVVDSNRKITSIQLVPEVASEPDYDQVLQAVRKLTGP